MKIVENHIAEEDNERRYHLSDPMVSDIDDTIFDPESSTLVGDIFRHSQKEFGRCVSKVYQDTPDGMIALGWVFQKRMQYEDDTSKSYIHEVWVSLYDEWQPTVIKKPHKIGVL